MAKTLDILHRCMRVGMNSRFTAENIDEIAEAFNSADAAVTAGKF